MLDKAEYSAFESTLNSSIVSYRTDVQVSCGSSGIRIALSKRLLVDANAVECNVFIVKTIALSGCFLLVLRIVTRRLLQCSIDQ